MLFQNHCSSCHGNNTNTFAMTANNGLDMVYEEKTSVVGFSWGFGVKINRFKIAYGSTGYHLNGGSNLFSITTNIKDF